RAGEAHPDAAAGGKPVMAEAARDLAREHGADRAVGVADRHLDGNLALALQRRLRKLDQAVVERLVEAVILALGAALRDLGRHLRPVEDAREVEPAGLPVLDAAAHVEQLGAPDEIVQAAHAEPSHQLAGLLGYEEQ